MLRPVLGNQQAQKKKGKNKQLDSPTPTKREIEKLCVGIKFLIIRRKWRSRTSLSPTCVSMFNFATTTKIGSLEVFV